MDKPDLSEFECPVLLPFHCKATGKEEQFCIKENSLIIVVNWDHIPGEFNALTCIPPELGIRIKPGFIMVPEGGYLRFIFRIDHGDDYARHASALDLLSGQRPA